MDGDTYLQLLLNHEEVGNVEWNMSTKEVLGGTGRATLTIIDKDCTLEPQAHWDIKVVIRGTAWVLWRGEIISPPASFITGSSARWWNLDCADYNNQLPQRLVGAYDGKTWVDEFGMGIYVNIDPFASSLETDKLTVQNLFDHYIRVDGEALDTTTFVQEYLADLPSISWSYSDLQSALDEMAALVVDNLQFWVDPDLRVHWVTIPAWQDLNALVAILNDQGLSQTAGMFPEQPVDGFTLAPVNISDAPSGTEISCRDLKITPDGSVMPQQVYVKGGTGYVYNAPPLVDETTVVHHPQPGSGTYQVTFTAATNKIWHTDGTGYVTIYYDTVGPSGPYKVKWVYVPWHQARNKGGHYWKMLSGPNVGWLVDDHTNHLSGYGHIVVEKVTTGTGEPQVGTGGSGWTNEVDQDPNLRQSYLDAPVSTDQARRDSLGGQALYRGATPTLRGSCKVSGGTDPTGNYLGPDQWRAGQLVQITDSRLPANMSGTFYVIQGVTTTLIPETDVREYVLDFGDGATSRYSAQPTGGDASWPPPAIQIDIAVHDLSPGPLSTQIVTGQLINAAGEPWEIKGKVVTWTLECYNSSGVLQPGVGSLTPGVSPTDKHGKARTKLKTGSGTNLVYFVFASVTAT